MAGCLCWGTIEGAGADELASLAAATGFTSVAITPAMAADVTGPLAVPVAMLDPLIASLPGAPDPATMPRRWRSTFEYDEEQCYALASRVGAPAINLAHYMCAPTLQADLIDALSGICQRAAANGVRVYVEFMPEGSIATLGQAAAIVRAIGMPHVGVLLDTWHHFRVGGTVAQVVEAAPVIHAVQVSDALGAVAGSWLRPPSADRLWPGSGVIPLASVLGALRPDAIIAIEVFDRAGSALPAIERAERAAETLAPYIERR